MLISVSHAAKNGLIAEIWSCRSFESLFGLDKLAIEFENISDEKVKTTSSLLFLGEGDPIQMEIGIKNLQPEDTKTIKVRVADLLVTAHSVSTQIVVRTAVELPSGEVKTYHSEPRFFHIDSDDGDVILYTTGQMADEFNGGLVDPTDLSVDLEGVTLVSKVTEEEAADFEVWPEGDYSYDEEMDPMTDEEMDPVTMSSSTRGVKLYNTKVCSHWRYHFDDSGIGEDYMTSHYAYQDASFAKAKIIRYGVTKWSGYLDAYGCTPTIGLPLGSGSYLKQYSETKGTSYPIYSRYLVKDCDETGPAQFDCSEMSISKSFTVSSTTNKYLYPSTIGGWINSTALTGYLTKSPDSGISNISTTTIKSGAYCPGWYPEYETSCWDSANDTIWIDDSCVNQKFVIAHEIGHQNQKDRIGSLGNGYNSWVSGDDWQCRCDHVVSSNDLHCMQSREAFATAMMEGFGYFFAAKLFNNEYGSNCKMAHSKEFIEPDPSDPENENAAITHYPPVTFDCRAQMEWQETYCDSANTGVEWDWMNFFWEWHTYVASSCKDGWCRIPNGCFIYGSPWEEWGHGNDTEVETPVTLSHDFVIQQHEMTRAEWDYLGFPVPVGGPDATEFTPCMDASCPIDAMNWWEAVATANRLSELHKLEVCYDLTGCIGEVGLGMVCKSAEATHQNVYDCPGYRLPTLAEWEYSTRAGTRTAFYSGDITVEEDGNGYWYDKNLDPIGWYWWNSGPEIDPEQGPDNAGKRTHKVEKKQPNDWNLYDMTGNVMEWTWDRFSGGGFHGTPQTDPLDDGVSERHTFRGCSAFSPSRVCRSGSNFEIPIMQEAYHGFGLRLARTVSWPKKGNSVNGNGESNERKKQ